MTLKQALWEIVRDENIIITNQNIDWLLDRALKKASGDAQALKESVLERKEKLDKLGESENKSNEELFKKALLEGINRRIDKTIEEEKRIEQIEEMRAILCRSGAINHCEYCADCEGIVEALYNAGYRKHTDRFLVKENGEIIPLLPKQSEWISVKDRLPETKAKQITICDQDIRSGEVTSKVVVEAQVSNTVVVVGKRHLYGKFEQYLDVDNTVDGQWANNECVTHWMPLPEVPKMKGGAE